MTDDMRLLIDLHLPNDRQGPGSDAATQMALKLAGVQADPGLKIADIGCGTGAAAFCLARHLGASVTAVDFLPEFLTELNRRAQDLGLAARVQTLEASMEDLPFDDASLDVIWSEGAIYNMGFESGLTAWRRFLKPGGVLAVSELTWLTDQRPEPLTRHWDEAYPEVATAGRKIRQIETAGYEPVGYFPLGTDCWMENYYLPLQRSFPAFLDRHGHSEQAKALVDAEQAEIALYETYSDFVSYGFYVARRLPD
ncbi:methyltransferase type 11 [Ruegeria lacuscaerulensis ITI-1157]|nr:methyltransferase type 11 [Ruegeria lacuscaerulensis ITI-1157]SHI93625.1 Ubiquinone/menaquinone biosynthesis C-methylase UbiE [Ruegeria lacuscaerulensis ITI-1157]